MDASDHKHIMSKIIHNRKADNCPIDSLAVQGKKLLT